MIWFATDERMDPEDLMNLLGFIPMFVTENNPLPAAKQFDANYQHGGGWRPIKGFTMDPITNVIKYPEDPPLIPIAHSRLRDERIYVYQYGMVAIVQPDGTFEISRMD